MAAGFDPAAFWKLTPRLYDLHMRGAAARIKREIESSNRQAWCTAALTGLAFTGKLPEFDAAFPSEQRSAATQQDDDTQEAMLWALAAMWGAERPATDATRGDHDQQVT